MQDVRKLAVVSGAAVGTVILAANPVVLVWGVVLALGFFNRRR